MKTVVPEWAVRRRTRVNHEPDGFDFDTGGVYQVEGRWSTDLSARLDRDRIHV